MEPRTTFIDAEGQLTDDPSLAVSGEITEVDDDGVELRHTYFGPDPDAEPLAMENPLPELGVEDFAVGKGEWDVYAVVGDQQVLADTLELLLSALGWDAHDLETQRAEVANLMVQPSWVAAPGNLNSEVSAWLRATRPSPQT